MNFTREPIIETIITPKEGYKLIVRNSKGSGQEEYIVDALEVVSFGHSFFFRSLERPKSFLVPVSDYEVIESKETRVALKTMSHERHIKIGGGREASVRQQREREPAPERAAPAIGDEERAPQEEGASAEGGQPGESRGGEKKRDRRRHRRRRSGGDDRRGEWAGGQRQQSTESQEGKGSLPPEAEEGGGAHDETQVSSQSYTALIPPPPTLISETISRYKDLGFSEAGPVSKTVKKQQHHEEPEEEKPRKNDEDSSGSDAQMNRTTTFVAYETQGFSTEFRGATGRDDTTFLG